MESPAEIGDLIAGKYRVDKVLGTGGMGVVVAATHVGLNEVRAIKMLRPKLATNPAYTDRFLQEAQAIARLKSEHIARVHDVGIHVRADGQSVPYMVIEYVEGGDFATVLRQRGAPPVEQAVTYVLQITEALAEAHKHNIVHRDIKPANLFLSTSNDGSACVKVIDFGIAKTAANLTQVGVVLGSPRYMSPEQIRESRDVDVRADIWSLGIVLYELLTGQTPFQGGGILEVCERIFEDDPARPSRLRADVPAALDAVVLRCLEKDRERRYPHVAALAEALAPFATEDARTVAQRVARVLGVALPARVPLPAAPAVDPSPSHTDVDPRPVVVLSTPDPRPLGQDTSTDLGPPNGAAAPPAPTLVYAQPGHPRPPSGPRVGSVTETSLGAIGAASPMPVGAVSTLPAGRGRLIAIAAVTGVAVAAVATAIAWPADRTAPPSAASAAAPSDTSSAPAPALASYSAPIHAASSDASSSAPLTASSSPSASAQPSSAPPPRATSAPQRPVGPTTAPPRSPGGLTSSRGRI
ncbi:MAG: serine/threonine-protein kinase [Polyangiaceae bacterium]